MELIQYLQDMLAEMHRNKLKIDKIWPEISIGWSPGENDYHREVKCQNPAWYSAICSLYPRAGRFKKKPRTIIKRKNIIELLERLIQYKTTPSKYAYHLVIEAKRRKREWENLSAEGFEEWMHAQSNPL